MSNNIFYRQCLLRRSNGEYRVAWLPERYAVKHRVLKLKDDGVWSSGWKVFNVYSDICKTEEQVRVDSEAYKHHMDVTDI